MPICKHTCISVNVAVLVLTVTFTSIGKRRAAVGTAMKSGFHSGKRQDMFVFSRVSKPTVGRTHTPIQYVSVVLSMGAKRQGREAHYPPPSSSEVNRGVILPSLIRLLGVTLNQLRAQTILLLPSYNNV
jgi:hypothetical protein